MDQMVEITIDGDWFANLLVSLPSHTVTPGENEFVAEAQAHLAKRGYVLDNEVTYNVRAPEAGEQTIYAPTA